MNDIVQYRCRIGVFRQKVYSKKFLYKQEYYETASWNRNQSGVNTLHALKFILKFIILSVLLTPPAWSTLQPSHARLTTCCASLRTGTATAMRILASSQVTAGAGYGWAVGGVGIQVVLHVGRETGNFWARYVNGNIRGAKGVHNMHFNIRSLRF